MEAQINTVWDLDFDLEKEDEDSYLANIQALRRHLGTRKNGDIFVLRPQQDTPIDFFNINLKTSKGKAKFRYRADDLYLVAYRIVKDKENGQKEDEEHWFEFQNEGRQLINNSTLLPYGSSYGTLLSNAKEESITGLRFDIESLKGIFNKFLTSHSSDQKRQAHCLLTCVLLVSEAMRFHPISKAIAANHTTQESQLTLFHYELVHAWDAIGKAIIKVDNALGAPGPTGITLEGQEITIHQARAYLAMMKP